MYAAVLSDADKAVKRKLIQISDKIRKKYLALKLARKEEDEALNRFFNPIKIPLTKIAETAIGKNCNESEGKGEENANKKIKKHAVVNKSDEIKKEEPYFQPTELIAETGLYDDDVIDDDDDNDNEEPISQQTQKSTIELDESYVDYLDQYPEMVQEFIDICYRNPEKIDTTYGIVHDEVTDSWKMGSEKVTFLKNGNIKVGPQTYKGTRGLYELLFLKEQHSPVQYDDKARYLEILHQTSAHRRESNPLNQIKGTKSKKYKLFIKPLISSTGSSSSSNTPKKFRSKSVGRGGGTATLLEYNQTPKEYVYYGNVNDLVERLAKLDASLTAGNGNHYNEIMTILNELSDLGVIELNK